MCTASYRLTCLQSTWMMLWQVSNVNTMGYYYKLVCVSVSLSWTLFCCQHLWQSVGCHNCCVLVRKQSNVRDKVRRSSSKGQYSGRFCSQCIGCTADVICIVQWAVWSRAAVAWTVQRRFVTISVIVDAGRDQTVSDSMQLKRSFMWCVPPCLPPSPTSHWIAGDRHCLCGSGYVCPRPCGTPWLWHVDGHAPVSACQLLLQCHGTNTLYPSILAAFVVGNTNKW